MKAYIPLFALLLGCHDSGQQFSSIPPSKIPPHAETPSKPVEATPAIGPYQRLETATEITITEQMISLGKSYEISVGGITVATVTGKSMRLGPDKFELKTLDGVLHAYETEASKWGQLGRAATFYDTQGNITGYLGEETFSDWGSMSYVFHFYDPKKTEIGVSKKTSNSSLGKHTISDLQDNVDYDIDKRVSLGDKYVVTVKDPKSTISLDHVVLLTCIEDAIGDAHK